MTAMIAIPQRIQRCRTPGWRMPAGAAYVGRPTVFGNPFTAAQAIEAGYYDSAKDPQLNKFLEECFRGWLRGSDQWWQGKESDQRRVALLARLPGLRGRDLVCWCSLDRPCHADVLLELANV